MKTRSGYKPLLRCVPATIGVLALAWPSTVAASPHRREAGAACAKQRTSRSKGRRARGRCRAKPHSSVSPDPHRFAVRATVPSSLTPATTDSGVAPESSGFAGEEPELPGDGGEVGSTELPPATQPPATEPPPATGPPATAGGAPFASAGVWAEPLPSSAPIDPGSTRLIGTLTARIRDEMEAGIGPRFGADTRTPLYRVAAGQPRVPVFLDTGPWGDRLAEELAAGVPIPSDAQPVAGA
ncbi:MAG TPA: hypothetical protein VLK56_04255, partial [Solirubrobacterales bacterium]|nr:hypothetical protein [Solirubrobacterales bacterium]